MSFSHNAPIHCQTCNRQFFTEVHDSINVTLEPYLKEDILSGKIFNHVCPHCGQIYRCEYDFLYHDMEHKIIDWFRTGKESIEKFRERIIYEEFGIDYLRVWEYTLKYYFDLDHGLLCFDRIEEEDGEQMIYFNILHYCEQEDTFSQEVNQHKVSADYYRFCKEEHDAYYDKVLELPQGHHC